MREVVGPNVDLHIEVHDRFTVTHAIRIGHMLEELQVMWLEIPLYIRVILRQLLEVARAIAPVPVAVDERYKRMGMFVDLLAAKVIDIVQPEVSNIKRVSGIAEATEALVACHTAHSLLGTVVNAHVHASIANFLIQEDFDDSNEPRTWIYCRVFRV